MKDILANHHLRFELSPSDPYKVIKIPVRQLGIKKVVIVNTKGKKRNVSTLQRARKSYNLYRMEGIFPNRKMPRVQRNWRTLMSDLMLIVLGGWAVASAVGCLAALIVWDIIKAVGRAIKRGIKKHGW